MFDLQKLIDDLGLLKGDLAELVGKGHTAVSNNIKRNSLPNEWRSHILKKYPDVNLTKYEFDLGIENKPVKSGLNIDNDSVKQTPFEDFMEVPVITVTAQAGYLNSIADGDEAYVNDLNTMLVPREFEKGHYAVVEIEGEIGRAHV